jgi:hypothetical protein
MNVLTGELQTEWISPQQVNVEDLANGVYSIIFSNGKGPLHYRKIVIMNRVEN